MPPVGPLPSMASMASMTVSCGSHSLSQLQEHVGEIFDLWPAVVHLGLFQTGDGAEEILDAAGIAGHGMGLQFTDINDIIGFHDRSDQVEAVIFKSCRTIYGLCGKVHVEFSTFGPSVSMPHT